MNQPVKPSGFREVAIADHGGGGRLMPQTFGDVVSFSEIMARSQHAIPKHLRDVPGACLAVTMQAMRWEMDPFAVASKSYNVKDLIAYEAQLIAAVVHTRAPLKTRPEYAYAGEGQDRRCTVSAAFDDGVTRSYESPRLADITTKNSPLWKADVDQQLGYYSIRAFARRYCPEVILGVYTPEEAETFRGPDNARDVTPRASLQDRLAASSGQGEGFSQDHVINEIDGNNSNSSEILSPRPAQTDTLAPASDAVGAGNPIQSSDESGVRQEDNALSHGESLQQGPDTNSKPSTAISSHGKGSEAANVANPAAVPDRASRMATDSSDSKLPQGFEITYAAALRRAQKPESLAKYATSYWEQYGGWAAVKDTDDGQTAVAIYDAFKNNFGDTEKIEAILGELF